MSKAALPFRVLVITDEPACARAGRGVVETRARALLPSAPGAAVLVRGGSAASRAELRALCAALLPIVRRAHALLLVHTFTDLVRELGLDGAHVSARLNFAEVTAARAALPAGALLGASRHDGDALDSLKHTADSQKARDKMVPPAGATGGVGVDAADPDGSLGFGCCPWIDQIFLDSSNARHRQECLARVLACRAHLGPTFPSALAAWRGHGAGARMG